MHFGCSSLLRESFKRYCDWYGIVQDYPDLDLVLSKFPKEQVDQLLTVYIESLLSLYDYQQVDYSNDPDIVNSDYLTLLANQVFSETTAESINNQNKLILSTLIMATIPLLYDFLENGPVYQFNVVRDLESFLQIKTRLEQINSQLVGILEQSKRDDIVRSVLLGQDREYTSKLLREIDEIVNLIEENWHSQAEIHFESALDTSEGVSNLHQLIQSIQARLESLAENDSSYLENILQKLSTSIKTVPLDYTLNILCLECINELYNSWFYHLNRIHVESMVNNGCVNHILKTLESQLYHISTFYYSLPSEYKEVLTSLSVLYPFMYVDIDLIDSHWLTMLESDLSETETTEVSVVSCINDFVSIPESFEVKIRNALLTLASTDLSADVLIGTSR